MHAPKNELPDNALEPAGQSWHMLMEVEPRSAEYLPEGHRIQTAEDVDPHPTVPVCVLQSVVATEYFPALQGVQASLPVWALYVPTAQIAQAVPSLVNPALH